jgi:hypothetical protein
MQKTLKAKETPGYYHIVKVRENNSPPPPTFTSSLQEGTLK